MKRSNIAIAALAAALSASSVAAADKWSDQFPHIKNTGDIPGECSYESMSQKDYSGLTLTISTHAVPVMGEPTALHAEQFSKLTGAKVDVIHSPAGDLYSKAMIPFQAGQAPYDIVFGFSNFIRDWMAYLEPVPEEYVNMRQMQDVTKSHIDVASWDGQMMQYPIDGDRHYLKYRKDVIDNPEMQAKYKAETGNDLRVPQTWKEYAEIASFFNGWDWDGDGEVEYGSAEVMKKDDLMYAAFFSRSVAYSKNPNTPGGFFFDLDTIGLKQPATFRQAASTLASVMRSTPSVVVRRFSASPGMTRLLLPWKTTARSRTKSVRRLCRVPTAFGTAKPALGTKASTRLHTSFGVGLRL